MQPSNFHTALSFTCPLQRSFSRQGDKDPKGCMDPLKTNMSWQTANAATARSACATLTLGSAVSWAAWQSSMHLPGNSPGNRLLASAELCSSSHSLDCNTQVSFQT